MPACFQRFSDKPIALLETAVEAVFLMYVTASRAHWRTFKLLNIVKAVASYRWIFVTLRVLKPLSIRCLSAWAITFLIPQPLNGATALRVA